MSYTNVMLSDGGGGGKSSSATGSETEVYIDTNVYDGLLTDLSTTASVLNIDESVFANAESANGTEAMAELIAELKEVRNVSNYYKTHMNSGVIPLLESVKNNIVIASQTAADAMSGN